MASPDVTYAHDEIQLVIKLKRPEFGDMGLQVKLSKVKLASSNAGEACAFVETEMSHKLHLSGRKSVTLQEMALIGAIMRDFFTNTLRRDGGLIIGG